MSAAPRRSLRFILVGATTIVLGTLLSAWIGQPRQDLPVFDDTNYFLDGHDIANGELTRALAVEWTPLIQYLAAGVWLLPDHFDPIWRYEVYRFVIHALFLAGCFAAAARYTRRAELAALATVLMLAGLELLHVPEIYLFCAGVLMLVLARLLSARRLELVEIAAWISLLILVRIEFVFVASMAAVAGEWRRRQGGAGPAIVGRGGVTVATFVLAVWLPVVIAASQRDGFAVELLGGGRLNYAVQQKVAAFLRSGNAAASAAGDEAIVREAFHLSATAPISFVTLLRADPSRMLAFFGDNTVRLLRGDPWESFPAAVRVVLLAGLAIWLVLPNRGERWQHLITAGHAFGLVILIVIAPTIVYVLHVVLYAGCACLLAADRLPTTRLRRVASIGPVAALLVLCVGLSLSRPTTDMPQRAAAAFLRAALPADAAVGSVIAEAYPENARAFACPQFERSVGLGTLALDADGRLTGQDFFGRRSDVLPVEFVLLSGDENAAQLPALPTPLEVVARRDGLTLFRIGAAAEAGGASVEN